MIFVCLGYRFLHKRLHRSNLNEYIFRLSEQNTRWLVLITQSPQLDLARTSVFSIHPGKRKVLKMDRKSAITVLLLVGTDYLLCHNVPNRHNQRSITTCPRVHTAFLTWPPAFLLICHRMTYSDSPQPLLTPKISDIVRQQTGAPNQLVGHLKTMHSLTNYVPQLSLVAMNRTLCRSLKTLSWHFFWRGA